ncbi:MAG: hypothetical protein LUQ64_03070 [Methanomicrobiales archaeon]|nr:hypothetical protein [Methanomicrobiales archaeon]
MVLASLREALGLLVSLPVLWLTGLATGILGVTEILLNSSGGSFYAGRLAILQLVILPFFLAGSLGAIRKGDGSPAAFLSSARDGYFRVLLPLAVVLAAAILTVFLVMIPASLVTGGVLAGASIVVPGVLVSFAFFTYFTDAAAILEERKVLDSIRRSVEFTIRHSWKVLLFYIVNLAILTAALILAVLAWSILLADQLLPLTQMNTTELAAITPGDLAGLIGPGGIWVTAAVAFLLLACCGTFVVAYRACFFRRHGAAGATQGDNGVIPARGEYDEKGRWYKY